MGRLGTRTTRSYTKPKPFSVLLTDQIDEERPRNKFRHFWSFFDHLLPSEAADGGLFAEVPKLSLFALLPPRRDQQNSESSALVCEGFYVPGARPLPGAAKVVPPRLPHASNADDDSILCDDIGEDTRPT